MAPTLIALLLIVIGLLLLAAELFIPSGGMIFVLAICAIVGGVTMMFIYSEDPYTGWVTLAAVAVLVPVLGGILLHYWPKTPIGKRMFLTGQEEDATLSSMPVNVELEQLRGRFGRTLSALRPAGVVDFDGRRIDVITEGMLVDAGRWVRCIDVRAGTVVVRPVDEPKLEDLETADFS